MTVTGSTRRQDAFDRARIYLTSDLRADLIAGFTTAVVLIPQGMAYAVLAGLPPIYGLYASILPLLGYAMAGSSRQLAVGPVATDSLLVATSLAGVAAAGSPAYVEAAVALAVMVGAIQLIFAFLRAGFVADVLSMPVIGGFSSAVALIIASTQIPSLLGIATPRSSNITETLHAVGLRLEMAHAPPALNGLVAHAAMLVARRFAPHWPRALLVSAVATLVVAAGGMEHTGVAVVGPLTSGLPDLKFTVPSVGTMEALAPSAFTLALVGFVEAIAVAKRYASAHQYAIDPNRELLGLGLANLAGSVSGAFPVSAGFSRTAVNDDAGARTRWASVFTAGTVALTLLFLLPCFHHLPVSALAAIVLAAVVGLVDVKYPRSLWRSHRGDFGTWGITFAATLAFGIGAGLLTGLLSSFLTPLFRSSQSALAGERV